jgi:hypothetical protein
MNLAQHPGPVVETDAEAQFRVVLEQIACRRGGLLLPDRIKAEQVLDRFPRDIVKSPSPVHEPPEQPMVETSDNFPDLGVAKSAGPRRVRVTIEFLPEPGEAPATPIVLEYNHASFNQEQGIHYVPGDTPSTWGQFTDMQPNGQHRASIQLWSGCESFGSFQARTTGPALVPEPPERP